MMKISLHSRLFSHIQSSQQLIDIGEHHFLQEGDQIFGPQCLKLFKPIENEPKMDIYHKQLDRKICRHLHCMRELKTFSILNNS